MRVCIKEGELNWNYHLVYGEEKAIEDGYKIIEIPDGYGNCALEDFDNNGFNVELYNKRKHRYENQDKLAELTSWFNTTYRYKHEKYTRLIALNKLDDDGVDANKKLLELYEEAEDVRRQIQELEEE